MQLLQHLHLQLPQEHRHSLLGMLYTSVHVYYNMIRCLSYKEINKTVGSQCSNSLHKQSADTTSTAPTAQHYSGPEGPWGVSSMDMRWMKQDLLCTCTWESYCREEAHVVQLLHNTNTLQLCRQCLKTFHNTWNWTAGTSDGRSHPYTTQLIVGVKKPKYSCYHREQGHKRASWCWEAITQPRVVTKHTIHHYPDEITVR